MAAARSAAPVRSHTTAALLLKRTVYGESDLIVTLFTDRLGRISALARGARRSQRRFAGALEPIHGMLAELDERASTELFTLREARLEQPRHYLTTDLERLECAGSSLNWLRRATPSRAPEPELWQLSNQFLDRLNAPSEPNPRGALAEFGLAMLTAMGWGLQFDTCIRCGRSCGEGQSALIAPEQGGLICRSCGGARRQLSGPLRHRLSAASLGQTQILEDGDAAMALELVERALEAHAGIE